MGLGLVSDVEATVGVLSVAHARASEGRAEDAAPGVRG